MDRERARARPSGGTPGGPGRGRGHGARRPGWSAAAGGLLGTVLAGALTVATALTGVVPEAPAGAAGARPAALTLVSQTAVVQPGQSFALRLRPAPSAGPAAGLALTVAVFPCLSSLSAFDQSVLAGPTGTPISQTTAPLPLAGLPTAAGGAVDLTLPVSVGPSSGPLIRLAPSGAQCQSYPSGVYPVRIQLVSRPAGTVVGSLTTHLVFTEATATTQRLRVAVVLPLQATQRSAAATPAELLARPEAALTPVDPGAVAALDATLASLADQHAAVPATLQVSGQTVGLLDTPANASALARLTQLAATPAVHQVTVAPFVPVDAAAMVAAGLSDELALQIARGAQTVAAASSRPVPDVTAGFGPWVAGGPVDGATLGALVQDGFQQVVLPSTAVSGVPGSGSTTQPFVLADGRGSSVVGMTAAADLTLRFVAAAGDPVLAAHQLVAELAQLYYERPNGTTPRAVVAAAPAAWTADPAFVDALFGSLGTNPLAEPVTLRQLFALFPTPATCRGGCRLAAPGGPGGLPVAAIRDQRVRVNGFASAAPGQRPLAQRLGDLVLGAEALALRPGQQAAVAGAAGAAVDAQLGQLAISGDQEITLTARSGRVPVTLVSSASYPVGGVLSLGSDRLLFPGGTSRWSTPVTVLPHHTTVVYVRVQARTSGTATVAVSLRSPDRSLRLVAGTVAVRTATTSVVGVILSAGAVAVLGAWWVRTSLRRRRIRKGEEAEDGRTPSGMPDGPGPQGPADGGDGP